MLDVYGRTFDAKRPVIDFEEGATDRLEGRLTFGGDGFDGALPTLVEAHEAEHVFVAVYDVTSADESTLDQWESADASGLYKKVRVRVETLDGIKPAWVYVLDDFEGGTPSARTLGILADAAQSAGAKLPFKVPGPA